MRWPRRQHSVLPGFGLTLGFAVVYLSLIALIPMAALFLRSWDRARRLESGLAGRGYEDALRTLEPVHRRSTAFLVGSLVLLAAILAGSLAWGVWR